MIFICAILSVCACVCMFFSHGAGVHTCCIQHGGCGRSDPLQKQCQKVCILCFINVNTVNMLTSLLVSLIEIHIDAIFTIFLHLVLQLLFVVN